MRLIRKSQSATEYAIFIAAVLVGLLALQVYYSRAVKGNVKTRADSVGDQFNTKDGSYDLETTSVSARNSTTGVATGNEGTASYSEISGGALDANTTAAASVFKPVVTKYAGGEVSTTKYGGTGYNDIGNVTSTQGVFQDSNMTN